MANRKNSFRVKGNTFNSRCCCICKTIKSIQDFPQVRKDSIQRKYRCRDCDNKKSRNYYLRNKNKVKNRIKLYHLKHPELRAKITSNWRKNNPKKWKEVQRIINFNAKSKRRHIYQRISSLDWVKMKKKYSYICPACLRKEPEIILTIDHIKAITKGGDGNIQNLQPLCQSCNSKKYTKTIKYEIPNIKTTKE